MFNKGLVRIGMQALTSNEHWSFEAGEKMVVGSAVWIDPTDGKAYLADNTADKPAHGFVGEASVEHVGLAVEDNHTSYIEEGDRFDLKHYLIFSTDVFDVEDVQKPIYLGTAGDVTTILPTTSTEIIQVIGRVISRESILLFVELAMPYETIA